MITESKPPSPIIQPGSLFFKVFRNSPVGMVIIDAAEGIYIDANEAFAELVGYSREELIHAPISPADLSIEMERETILDTLRRVRRLADIPVTITRRDGVKRSCIFSLQLEEIDGAAYFYIIAQDHSRQARAQLALQLSETRFRRFYSNMPLPLLVIDQETGKIIDFNPAAGELYGYNRDHFLSMTFDELSWPGGVPDGDGMARDATHDDRQHPSARANSVFGRHRLNNGSIIEVNITSYSFVLDEKPVQLSIIQDVTEERTLQKQLEQSEERFGIIADMTADAIWELNLITNKVYWSAGLSSLDGYPAELDDGFNWWLEHIHAEDRAFIHESMERTLESESTFWSAQYRFQRLDGSYATVLDSGFIIREKGERPLHIVGSMVDITKHLQLAEAASRAALEERQRLAHHLHDTVTQSLYSVSLMAEASRRRAESGEWEVLTEYIGRLGELTIQTLRQMRLLVYELRPNVLEQEGLPGALRHRLEAVEHRAGIRATLIDETSSPIPAHLKHDLFWIAQEALNNSLKHASATNISVVLRRDAKHTILEVRDNGSGFDEGTLDQTGGLSAIRRRVLELGGTLAMDSVPQSGTTIRVGLPE